MKRSAAFVAAAAASLFIYAMPAQAVTLDFDPAHPGNFAPYTEGAYQFDVARIVNGNCNSVSGRPCLALNSNSSPNNPFETSTLTRTDGAAFSLNSFWFQLLGDPTALTVSSYIGAVLQETFTLTSSVFDHNDGGQVYNHVFSNVTSVVFANLISDVTVQVCEKFDRKGNCKEYEEEVRKGNIRIDDLNLTSRKDGGPVDVVPVPAALPLLASGLAGIGLLARRRKAKVAR